MTKELEILDFLDEHVFSPALGHPNATFAIKADVRIMRLRMATRNAAGMILYFWSAIAGEDRSAKFARQMKSLGIPRFEEALVAFRDRFNDDWLAR